MRKFAIYVTVSGSFNRIVSYFFCVFANDSWQRVRSLCKNKFIAVVKISTSLIGFDRFICLKVL